MKKVWSFKLKIYIFVEEQEIMESLLFVFEVSEYFI